MVARLASLSSLSRGRPSVYAGLVGFSAYPSPSLSLIPKRAVRGSPSRVRSTAKRLALDGGSVMDQGSIQRRQAGQIKARIAYPEPEAEA